MQEVDAHLPRPPSGPAHPINSNIVLNAQKLYHEVIVFVMIVDFSVNTQQHFSILDDCYDVLPQVLCERRKQKGYCSIEGWKDYLRKNCAYTCRFCGK